MPKVIAQHVARRFRAAVPFLILFFAIPLCAQQAPSLGPADWNDRLAPYVPTPMVVVEKMLELAQVDHTDRVYDLGSGDGRIVIMAAQKFGAEAVGVELDDHLASESEARITELGLQKRAKILHANMYKVDLRRATVVTLYLLTSVNERLRPILEKSLRKGARVVTHDFKVPGWEPEKTETVVSDSGVSHTLFLYVRP
jgi:SAM-dependent methyltransferase